MSGAVTYRVARFGGCLAANVGTRADGCRVLRSTEPLQTYPKRLSDRLAHWAREAPDRTFVARRGQDDQWERITYAQMLERAQRLTEEEQASNTKVMICCAGCKSERLVLDL